MQQPLVQCRRLLSYRPTCKPVSRMLTAWCSSCHTSSSSSPYSSASTISRRGWPRVEVVGLTIDACHHNVPLPPAVVLAMFSAAGLATQEASQLGKSRSLQHTRCIFVPHSTFCSNAHACTFLRSVCVFVWVQGRGVEGVGRCSGMQLLVECGNACQALSVFSLVPPCVSAAGLGLQGSTRLRASTRLLRLTRLLPSTRLLSSTAPFRLHPSAQLLLLLWVVVLWV